MSDGRDAGFWSKIQVPLNIIMSSTVAFLYIHDKHDKEQRIYLKSLLFGTGLVGIINFYRYSGLGLLIDDILDSDIFFRYSNDDDDIETAVQRA